MIEVIFLLVLAFVWVGFATIQDVRKREVADWLNFSLLIFALGFRFFYSLFYEQAGSFLTLNNFFYQGLIGLVIFFILGNLFYYARIFAGGDAKLLISLGAILPLSNNFFVNLKIFYLFIIVLLVVGGIYGLVYSFFLAGKNFGIFKKEFSKQFNFRRRLFLALESAGVVLILLGILQIIFLFFGIFIFLIPLFYIYAKSVDESCNSVEVSSGELTTGDWLYKDIRLKNKIIKANWEGLTPNEIKLIQKYLKNKKIKIRRGIPFVPVFLISFVLLVLIYLGLFKVFF